MICPDPTSQSFKQHTTCRVCGNPNMMTVFDLGQQPLANDFVGTGGKSYGKFPLRVMLCETCDLGQLSVVVDPAALYYYYAYATSPSQTMLRHFETLHRDLLEECGQCKSLLEIGSNDGRLLEFFREHGVAKVLGVDPSVNMTKRAIIKGLPTLVMPFSSATVDRIKAEMSEPPSLILGRHVLCHIDDWHDLLKALEGVAGPQTVIAFETPYAGDLLRNVQFDTIYHEHLSYLSLQAVKRLVADTSFFLRRVIHYPDIHGGAILTVLRHFNSGVEPHRSVLEGLNQEDVNWYRWTAFRHKAHELVASLAEFVRNLRDDRKRVAGYGASAKSTVWINAAGFTSKEVEFITDTTSEKQGALSPGTDIPIVPPEHLLSKQPDYAILFAWNYEKEIVEKEQEYLQRGGRFIVPVPRVRVVELANPVGGA